MEEISSLVAKAKNGDNNAFDELYCLTQQEVWFTCISLLKNETIAEEIMQNTYVTAFLKLNTLEDDSKFSQWIKKIAVNKCKDFFKTKKEIQLDDEILENYSETTELTIPEEYISDNENRRIILEIMHDSLSEVQYRAVLMYYFDEMTVSEIAEIEDCPEGTVMSRLNLARAKMKKAILKYEEENDDRLHSVVPVPFFVSLFFSAAKNLTVPKVSIDLKNVKTVNSTAQAGKNIANFGGKLMAKSNLLKLFAIIAAFAVVIGGITAAVVVNNNNNKNNEDSQTGEEISSVNNKNDSSDENGLAQIDYHLDEQVLFDNDKCTITVTGCKVYSDRLEVEAELKNKTTDEEIKIDSDFGDYYFVNKYNCYDIGDVGYGCTDPGETDSFSIEFNFEQIKECGITFIDELAFNLQAYNTDNHIDEDTFYCNQMFYLYPTGKTADEITPPERKTTDTEQVVFDNEYGELVFLNDYITSYSKDIGLKLYAHNKMNKDVKFEIDSTKLNGKSIYGTYRTRYFGPDMNCYYDIYIDKEDFEEYKNESGKNVLEFRIVEEDSNTNAWSGLSFDTAIYEDTLEIQF
ncbi:RNA polymerase sigma factor [Ruminococcus sp.]|uniref:RNA polymerase sigma factor n=1 Tax=Ruminococcus sp. TaxID=41978 RepID=UPI00386922EE